MANCEKLIPTILKWETGTDIRPGETPFEMFNRARKKGFANDPVDPGGATMCGIILDTYKSYCKKKHLPVPGVEELKAIRYSEWFDIFKTMFWDRMKADQIENQSVANLCVNTIWGSGPGYIKVIQKTAGAYPDGIVGPKTIQAINGQDQHLLFNKLWNRRKKFFEDIVAEDIRRYENKVGRHASEYEKKRYTKYKFLKGWMNRLNDFQFEK